MFRVLLVIPPKPLSKNSIFLFFSPSRSFFFHPLQSKTQAMENVDRSVTPEASSSRRESGIVLSFLFHREIVRLLNLKSNVDRHSSLPKLLVV